MELKFRNIKEFLYLGLWFIYSFSYILNSSVMNIGAFFKLESVLIIGILALMFFFHDYMKLKKVILAVIFFAACLLITRVTHKTVYLLFIMFIANSDYSKFDRIVRTTMISIILSTGLVVLMSLAGIIPDYIFVRDTGEIAHSYGFTYYYNLSAQAMYASILYIYLKDNVKWIELFVIAGISYVIYKECTTRLPFYVLLIIIFVYVLLYKWNVIKTLNHTWIKCISLVAFPAVCIGCVIFAQHYDPSVPMYSFSNDILNGRPRLSHVALNRYGMKLFGQYVEMKGNTYGETQHNYFFIDSGYILSVVEYGLIFTVILLALYSFIYYYSCRTNNKKLFIWISMTLVFNVVNGCWFTLIYNPIFFILFHMDYSNVTLFFERLKSGKIFVCRE